MWRIKKLLNSGWPKRASWANSSAIALSLKVWMSEILRRCLSGLDVVGLETSIFGYTLRTSCTDLTRLAGPSLFIGSMGMPSSKTSFGVLGVGKS